MIENKESLFSPAPVKYNSVMRLKDYIVWCGSMVRTPCGKCHLFLSIWPRKSGFEGWVTHSQIGYAVADSPESEFCFRGIVFKGRGSDSWDRDVIHNPTVYYWNGKFYLYYTGNHGNGEYWSHRDNQRIGVAVAHTPEGPWLRQDKPLLDIAPDSWDCLLVTNPSVARMPDGRFILIYKAAGTLAPPPMRGPILHGVAFSDSPTGPFTKHPKPIFESKKVNFPGEDPFVFTCKGKLYTILKDISGYYYSKYPKSLVLFESTNGIEWKLAERPLVISRMVEWEDGRKEEMFRLERPQLYFEDETPRMLFSAVKPSANLDDAFNIHLNIEFNP